MFNSHVPNAPNPMVTVFKTIDVTKILKYSKKNKLKFNMLTCYAIGSTASSMKEFYMLPVGEVSSCDIEFCDDIKKFSRDYLYYTKTVCETCKNHDLSESMVIGTSALAEYDIDGVVGMYSGIYNNPFVFWRRYNKSIFKTTLKVSFQFHHTQMDGAHAGKFLELLQKK